MPFDIKIQPEVKSDIQEAVNWYNEQEKSIGGQFFTSVQDHIERLETNPFFHLRYDNVRCMPMKKFPYIIHFTVDEAKNQVTIHGVLSTHRDPKIWEKRL